MPKTEYIHIRSTDQEKDTIKENAAKHDLDVTSFLLWKGGARKLPRRK